MNKIIKIILFLAFGFSITPVALLANEKIRIGLLVPLTGKNSEIGQSIIKSTRLAINTINNASIEIIPKDTQSNPEVTLKAAKELANSGIKIVIGPVFNESLIYLSELSELTFLALTNKNDNFSKNIINAGINATSQLNAIKKFIELNEIKKTIFLTPDVGFKNEIEKAISNSKIKILENYIYNTDPTKLTKQIEKITRYEIRKQNLEDEINRLEKSEQSNKELLIERLKKRDTLGSVKFDSVVISDFDESLKSVTTSLLYTDITPKEKYFITLNQWFDESLLKETSSQPLYFPSANKDNYDEFSNEYFEKYNQYPNQLSFLSYDLVGLVYYLILQNESVIDKKMFTKKTLFKGKVGVFEIKNNKINHILNFYKAEDGEFKKVF
ncbi:ABC transporter substrate-binding protein [Candidatus Pelagibacter ubique]|uniref:Possible transmembrane receptor n=1 Tax=Pelagibacter ubique (strain HTCC1062) TaxID=335992 RepID=Q4FNP6_PELUB|nr:ABC transporter substrate-binding protein [Candidatus Pelagibacter ubique]AAZ21193.1 possible transmembrane receptor [Candidatus Pelagibacter ubique HTCC1062]MDA9063309.1 ABC transporter substrate-binding protein [Candidatus Pelagibacter ubique]MDB9740396.1 ABC transporter substrate-binding protein [Candidatus Pelagibacter ubique]